MENKGYLLVWCEDPEEWNGKQTDDRDWETDLGHMEV